MIAIIDYGMGNLASVKKALDYLDLKNAITNNQQEIEAASAIILPGVGSFQQGMNNLHERELVEVLNHEVKIKKKPFWGICLGMQLIFSLGTEPHECNGLGWIKGKVVKIKNNGLRIPHMGWNTINPKIQSAFDEATIGDYYFIHSYHVLPEENDVIAATVSYQENLVASVLKENIFATQFHPEKSQDLGLSLLKKFFHAC